MRITFDVNVNLNMARDPEIMRLLNEIIKQNTTTMATIQELNAKVDTLQTTIDETQAAALDKITTLETTVQELRDQIANGGDATELQAIADKLDAATADLKATFPSPEA